jgi:hypothetical protein
MSEPDKGVTVARAKNEEANVLKNMNIDSISALWDLAIWNRRSEGVSSLGARLRSSHEKRKRALHA